MRGPPRGTGSLGETGDHDCWDTDHCSVNFFQQCSEAGVRTGAGWAAHGEEGRASSAGRPPGRAGRGHTGRRANERNCFSSYSGELKGISFENDTVPVN